MLWVTVTIALPLKRDQEKGEEMKLSKAIQSVIKKEGRHALSTKTILRLKKSKEFSYLVDLKR